MDETQIIGMALSLVQQIKLFHWTTTSFARHQALDQLHDALQKKTDMLVESFLGRNTKAKVPIKNFTVQTSSHSDASKLEKYLESERDKLQAICDKLSKQPEIQNTIQDIMSELDKALYLCRFQ